VVCVNQASGAARQWGFMAENAGEIPIAKIPNFQKPIPNEKPNGRKEGAAGFFNESFLLIAPFSWPLGI
jgi:hypothetical protein